MMVMNAIKNVGGAGNGLLSSSFRAVEHPLHRFGIVRKLQNTRKIKLIMTKKQ
jgi:hypothetical protein